MKIFLKGFFILIAILSIYVNAQSPDEDEVQVPVPNYPHKFYSGYLDLTVEQGKKKSIHYVFFQSQTDVSKDPLVVWYSGGPGCSSLLGSFHQNGPFNFKTGKHTFQYNQNAWNKNANLLYFEIPAGVGFSQLQDTSEQINDDIFVQQGMAALVAFFARFQIYKKNDLFLTGHAYGAVFIANLAKKMIDQNLDPFSVFNDKWNIKGVLMGNPCTKPDQCYAPGSYRSSKYHYEFLYKRGFYNKVNYQKYQQQCQFNENSYECYQQRLKMDSLFNDTNTSQYNIYDKCYRGQNDTVDLNNLKYVNTGCQDQAGLITYLNDPIVQGNWNIRPKQWKACSVSVFNKYVTGKNCYHILPYLIKNHIRLWIYSGDLDSKIPVLSTKKWVSQFKDQNQLPILKNWRQWWVPGKHKGEDQVGGFIWEIQGFNFVTVKGAGLRAGLDQPQAMEQLLAGFLKGQTLPYKQF